MAIEIIEKIAAVLEDKKKPITMYELIKEVNKLGRTYTHQQIKYVLGRMVKEETIHWDKEEDSVQAK